MHNVRTADVATSCLIVSFGKASIAESNVSNQALLTTVKKCKTNKAALAACVLERNVHFTLAHEIQSSFTITRLKIIRILA